MHDHILKEFLQTDATKAAEFIKYITATGILVTLNTTLEKLIEMENRPKDPLELVIRNLSNGNVELIPPEAITSVQTEFDALKLKVKKLEARVANLKHSLSKHELVEFDNDEENGKQGKANKSERVN